MLHSYTIEANYKQPLFSSLPSPHSLLFFCTDRNSRRLEVSLARRNGGLDGYLPAFSSREGAARPALHHGGCALPSVYRGTVLLPRQASLAPPQTTPKPSSSSGRSATEERALKIHSEAERRRRERINAHLAALRKMIPDAKQFRWRLYKKALQILHLHFALKRHEFFEEFHEKQEQVSHTMDPLDDSTFNNVWMATAKTNTMIYQDVFSCVPNDPIHSRTQFQQSFAHWRDKIGHTTIDLGVAQEKLETYQDSDLKGASL